MRAKKCDRCKQFYESNSNFESNNERSRDIYRAITQLILVDDSNHYSHEYDLCDECVRATILFLKGDN